MSTSLSNLLLLGDWSLPEAQPLLHEIRRHDSLLQTRVAVNLSAVRRILPPDDWFPDLVVVLQTWPDQFLAAAVQQLLSQFPLARVVCCYGPWCDSDGRSFDTTWPLAVRVPLQDAGARIEQELAALCDGRPPPLPLTASRGEIFLQTVDVRLPQTSVPTPVLVVTPDRPYGEMLCAMLRQGGYAAEFRRSSGGIPVEGNRSPGILLWDADPWDEQAGRSLESIRRACPTTRIVALVGAPREDVRLQLWKHGADGVRCKLSPLGTLLA